MTNNRKWVEGLAKIGRTVDRLIKQIGHAPTRILSDMPDGRWAVIIAPSKREYHIYIVDNVDEEDADD